MATSGWKDVSASDIARIQARGAAQPPKPSKYRNVKVTIDGHRFDSKREAAIYQDLKARQSAGEIRNLKCQVPFDLCCPAYHIGFSAWATLATYIADFTFEERLRTPDVEWASVVADCKGGRNTQMFELKKKWLWLQNGIEIRELR